MSVVHRTVFLGDFPRLVALFDIVQGGPFAASAKFDQLRLYCLASQGLWTEVHVLLREDSEVNLSLSPELFRFITSRLRLIALTTILVHRETTRLFADHGQSSQLIALLRQGRRSSVLIKGPEFQSIYESIIASTGLADATELMKWAITVDYDGVTVGNLDTFLDKLIAAGSIERVLQVYRAFSVCV